VDGGSCTLSCAAAGGEAILMPTRELPRRRPERRGEDLRGRVLTAGSVGRKSVDFASTPGENRQLARRKKPRLYGFPRPAQPMKEFS
jgi:hypothetical protein